MKNELYKKVYIKSIDDLPKDNAEYICKVAGNDRMYVFNGQIVRDYGLSIDWYLQPIEQSEPVSCEANKPKIVCICGSGRFLKKMHIVGERLTLEGKIVLMIGVNTKDVARTEDMSQYKPMLDELHLRKIDLSDSVYVVNVDGYIGELTRKEIIYAESKNKPIEYLERETPGKVPILDEKAQPVTDEKTPVLSDARLRHSIIKGYERRTDDGLHYLTIRDVEKAMKKYMELQSKSISLPSDEEIETAANNYEKKYCESLGVIEQTFEGAYKNDDFCQGAKWMRSKIKSIDLEYELIIFLTSYQKVYQPQILHKQEIVKEIVQEYLKQRK